MTRKYNTCYTFAYRVSGHGSVVLRSSDAQRESILDDESIEGHADISVIRIVELDKRVHALMIHRYIVDGVWVCGWSASNLSKCVHVCAFKLGTYTCCIHMYVCMYIYMRAATCAYKSRLDVNVFLCVVLSTNAPIATG